MGESCCSSRSGSNCNSRGNDLMASRPALDSIARDLPLNLNNLKARVLKDDSKTGGILRQ
jgi:hypothetical protein